jgi:hypothetical protein
LRTQRLYHAIHKTTGLECQGAASEGYVHAEMTLAMSILYQGCKGNIYLSVSKQSCYLCETWLTVLNQIIHDPTFRVPEGHKKAYEGWKLPGVNGIDGALISEVWEQFDDLLPVSGTSTPATLSLHCIQRRILSLNSKLVRWS